MAIRAHSDANFNNTMNAWLQRYRDELPAATRGKAAVPGLLYQGLRVRLSQDTPNSLFGRDDLDEEPMLDVLVRLSGPLWREIERERD